MNEDFYVGYVPRAPTLIARSITRIVIGVVLVALVISAILIVDQPPFAASKFEYGQYGDYSGVIEEWPYPLLITSDSSFLLVAPGKHGLSEYVRGLAGKSVRLKGSRIEFGADRMLEVLPGSISDASAVAGRPATIRSGWGELAGVPIEPLTRITPLLARLGTVTLIAVC